MAYIKYKELTKYFYFNKIVDKDTIPKYLKEYIYDDEKLLAVYKTRRDHGLFTDKKIVLFDVGSSFGIVRKIYTIPYKSISNAAVHFGNNKASLIFMMDSGYPVDLKFVSLSALDKLRLRLLYNVITQVINNQEIDKNIINILINDELEFDKKEGK